MSVPADTPNPEPATEPVWEAWCWTAAGRDFFLPMPEVKGYCARCYHGQPRVTDPDREVRLVSPTGLAHHGNIGRTDCGREATGPDWWWRL